MERVKAADASDLGEMKDRAIERDWSERVGGRPSRERIASVVAGAARAKMMTNGQMRVVELQNKYLTFCNQ